MHFRPYEPLNTCTREWESICPIEVPVDLIILSQEYTYDFPLPEGHSFCGDRFIHLVYYKGGIFLSDGHNRLKECRDRGETTIMARLKFKI